MYTLQKTDYGFYLTLTGDITEQEMEDWLQESYDYLKNQTDEFLLFVDMRDIKIISSVVKKLIIEGQKLYRGMGMMRSVMIVNDKFIKMQFQNIARESGIDQYERYVNSQEVEDWLQIGLDWIKKGIDPDM